MHPCSQLGSRVSGEHFALVLALDISNYTDPITLDEVNQWKAQGVGLVIVQAWPGRVQQQLAVLKQANMLVDGYVFVYKGDTPALIKGRLSLLDGYTIRRLWLDVEIVGVTLSEVRMALQECDLYPTKLNPTGVYTAHWYWPTYMRNYQGFSDRLLWDANYDGVADASQDFKPYGGWTWAAIKQYQGTSTVAGVGNVDIDVLSAEEVGELPQETNMAITVGEGMANQMAANSDAPLCGHKNYTEVDDAGNTYNVEECLGAKGRYVSANSSGGWVNGGPF